MRTGAQSGFIDSLHRVSLRFAESLHTPWRAKVAPSCWLGGGQALLARQGLAVIDGGLADPVGDGLRGDTELTRELCW